MTIRKIGRGAIILAIAIALSGPWAFAYNGLYHDTIFKLDDYSQLESLIWYVVIGFIFNVNYNSLIESDTAKQFLLNSTYTACCVSFLLMMDWHHKVIIVPLYLTLCFICGSAAYALHRYEKSLKDA